MLAYMISQRSDNFLGKTGGFSPCNFLDAKTNLILLVGCIWMGNIEEPVCWYLIILSIMGSASMKRPYSPFTLLLEIKLGESFILLHHEVSLIFSKIILI